MDYDGFTQLLFYGYVRYIYYWAQGHDYDIGCILGSVLSFLGEVEKNYRHIDAYNSIVLIKVMACIDFSIHDHSDSKWHNSN